MGKVTVVGSYIVALVMDTERNPIEGETVIGNNYHSTHGGKGSNMAVCASRLGAEAAFMGKIGRDSFGDDFLDLIKSEDVSTDGVLFSDQYPTAVGFIIFSSKGTNLIVIDIAANGDFSVKDIEEHSQLIQKSDVILSPLEIPIDTALAASQVASSSGVKSILNPAPAMDLRDKNLETVYAITPNETEGRVCLGMEPSDAIHDEDLARELLSLGTEHVILTCGANGVLWASADGIKAIPALNVDVVDSVGAGDAFNAGFAVGLSENKSMEAAIALGVTAASLSTLKRETIESYVDRDQVDNRIHEILDQLEIR